jgi:hypothetical protein
MFVIDCPRHQSRVLLGTRSIEALVNTPDGIDVHWRCQCGARGTLHTGNRRTDATAPTAAAIDPPTRVASERPALAS